MDNQRKSERNYKFTFDDTAFEEKQVPEPVSEPGATQFGGPVDDSTETIEDEKNFENGKSGEL